MSKITDFARGQDCLLRLPGVCNGNPETSVWAHSNRYADGKGAGLKADDRNGCIACYACHMVYDRQFSRPAGLSLAFVETRFTAAMKVAQAMLKKAGLWDAPAPVKRARKSSKLPVPNNSRLARLAR
jgi:hypothetical protein